MQLWPDDVRNVQPSDVVALVDRVQQVACIDFDTPQSHSCNQKTPMKIRHRNILSAAMLATACHGAMAAATDYLNRVYGGASARSNPNSAFNARLQSKHSARHARCDLQPDAACAASTSARTCSVSSAFSSMKTCVVLMA